MKLKTALSALSVVLLLGGCAREDSWQGGIKGDTESFTLTYTIPDTDVAGTRAVTYAGNVPIARASESKISDVLLLFFEADDFGNGVYAGSLTGTVEGDNLANSGSISVTIPTGGAISADSDYNVLVVANAGVYFPTFDFDAYCAGKTENIVKIRLQGDMPRTVDSDQKYDITDTCLLMSGTARKQAGKDMSVVLLRAAVRVDVRVADAVKDNLILTSATVSNVSAAIPLFSSPRDVTFTPLKYGGMVTAVANSIVGGLYVSEVLRTVNTPTLRASQATCVLVNCKEKDYAGTKTWYRVNLSVSDDYVQYLRRNNAYTLEIQAILTPGEETPDDAENNEANLQIKAVLIPSAWDVPEGVVPPQVDVN